MRTRGLLIALSAAVLATGCGQTDESAEKDGFAGEAQAAYENALDNLQQKYDELIAERGGDPVQWASDDIENLGDWEYHVETIPFGDNEALAARLNELGNDRWEALWFERTAEGYVVVMKKPSISLLSKIPLSQLGRMLIPGGEAQ